MRVTDLLPEGGKRLVQILAAGDGCSCLELPELEEQYLVAMPLEGIDKGLSVTAADMRTMGVYFGAVPASRIDNRLFKTVIAAYPFGLMMIDSSGEIIYANDDAASIIGESREELEGHPVSRLSGMFVSGEWLVLDVIAGTRPMAGLASCPRGESAVFVSGIPVFGPDGSFELAVFTMKSLESSCFGEEYADLDRSLFESVRDEVTGHRYRPGSSKTFVTKSPAMRKTLDLASRLARSQQKEALVTGEPGTGKDEVARFIHENSSRSSEPYVRISCARREPLELEKEIFGAEAGHTTVAGLLEAASNGTVCLEDADALPGELQKRLSDFVSKRVYHRAGGSASVKSDVFLLLTASGNPNSPAEDGRLFHGLAEALAGSCISVPPLRSRREDVVELARVLMKDHNESYGLRRYLDPAAADLLLSYRFPGNLRELKSALHKAVVFSGSPNVGPYLQKLFGSDGEIVPAVPGGRGITDEADDRVPTLQTVRKSNLNTVLGGFERKILDDAIRVCRSTREMASMLGISQAGVSRKLKKFRLDAPGKYPRK
ncbi:MAG: sigma 54-interacting transcriptional regulator [Deltaproteobacteria bacterium]|nr:sigma 54-interacting transcriptional regulator [Deltaproteobacteria bacterium]